MSDPVKAGDVCTRCDKPIAEGELAAWNANGSFHANCIPDVTHAYFFGRVPA